MSKRSLADRLWSKVDKSGDCWIWTGCKTPFGHGRIYVSGANTTDHVHRVVYEMFHGAIPPRMVVMHRCDNPPCCNPDHLTLGSHKDNMEDRDHKKRQARISCGNHSSLTDMQRQEIRRLRTEGMTLKAIGDRFGMTKNGILYICKIAKR
jgi:hypothetical protein